MENSSNPTKEESLESLLLAQSLVIGDLTHIILNMSSMHKLEHGRNIPFIPEETENKLNEHLKYLVFMTNNYIGSSKDD